MLVGGAQSWGQSAEAQHVGVLSVGDVLFWNGEYLGEGSRSYGYKVRILDGAVRLRIAIDVPTRTDEYRVELFSPSGERVARFFKGYEFSHEVIASQVEAGEWTIRVHALDVTDSAFRMRARLESQSPGHKVGVLAPDLRMIPPYDFTFSAPDDGAGSDYDNYPDDQGPIEGAHSCAQDEVLEANAMRCLRFSAGIENAGDGPLDLRFVGADPDTRINQILHHSDGRRKSRPAGRFEYHETHEHFHYKGAWTFELFLVTNEDRGEIQAVGRGHKGGFCPADQKIADWRRFVQVPAFSTESDCGMRFRETPDGFVAEPKTGPSSMGFSTGWGDVYGWYRPGNYVEFGTNRDGTYVVRATVDKRGRVKETNERNNVGYALISVTGLDVALLERGRGTDPWDPNKVVIRDWWERLD